MSNRTAWTIWSFAAASMIALVAVSSHAAPAGQPVPEPKVEPALTTFPWTSTRHSADPLARLVRELAANPQAYSYAHLSGAVAREVYKDLDGDDDLSDLEKKMDGYARDLQDRLVKAGRGVDARLAAFNRFVYEKKLKLKSAGPLAKPDDRADHYFLHRVLKKKSGVCLGLSLVTLDLGESIVPTTIVPFASGHYGQAQQGSFRQTQNSDD